MMAAAFMGYVLPWGANEFLGATVITNLFSAIPLVGEGIVTWLWGGYSVDNPTLYKIFYSSLFNTIFNFGFSCFAHLGVACSRK